MLKGMRKSSGEARGLSPALSTALAAAAASAAGACVALAVAGLSQSLLAIAVPLALIPPLAAAAAWFAARRAIRGRLEMAAANLERFAELDLSAGDPLPPGDGSERLGEALERCRATLAGRHGAVKVHAAVARLVGAAVGRLAVGDFSARVTVELPVPYRTFRDDFNAAMERLESTCRELEASGGRLLAGAREIDEAAQMLARRAAKLAERIDADLRAIDAGGTRRPEEALRLARHTLSGAGVAARRNGDAAAHFAGLGLGVARGAEDIVSLSQRMLPPGEDIEAGEAEAAFTQAAGIAIPASHGATALKLEEHPG